MTSKEFMEFLDSIGARYHYTDNDGKLEQVYVFEKAAYDKKHANPRKYKDLYVSYLRVSNFGGDLYTREDGWTCYMPDSVVMQKCIELTEEL